MTRHRSTQRDEMTHVDSKVESNSIKYSYWIVLLRYNVSTRIKILNHQLCSSKL